MTDHRNAFTLLAGRRRPIFAVSNSCRDRRQIRSILSGGGALQLRVDLSDYDLAAGDYVAALRLLQEVECDPEGDGTNCSIVEVAWSKS